MHPRPTYAAFLARPCLVGGSSFYIKLQPAPLARLLPLNGHSGLITCNLLALLVLFEERDGGVPCAPLHGGLAGMYTAAHPSYPLLGLSSHYSHR